MEMKAKKTTHKKAATNAGDRESRLREILGASGSAEEALLKQAAHFDLLGNAESAEMASEEMVKVRVVLICHNVIEMCVRHNLLFVTIYRLSQLELKEKKLQDQI